MMEDMRKMYTIGEIFRLGLLKNHKGEPYSSKIVVSRMVDKYMKFEVVQTPWGPGKSVSEAEIKKFNERQLKYKK